MDGSFSETQVLSRAQHEAMMWKTWWTINGAEYTRFTPG